MGDWQELAQSVLIGVIFAFLVAKLISVVMSFREENLRVVRGGERAERAEGTSMASLNVDERVSERESLIVDELGGLGSVGETRVCEEENVRRGESFLGEDEDDWEGVESTELDEAFSAATAFVATAAADRLSAKVSSEVQLQLYGLYKIATEGPCNAPQPSALKMTARAKWNAWQKLGTMHPEEAMQKYIEIVTELYPTWASGSTSKSTVGDGDGDSSNSGAKGTMGPVFSSLVYEEEPENQLQLDAIHAAAREGEINDILEYIKNGVSVNLKDSEGRTPLHWAVDRGHLEVAELLVSNNADVNAKVKVFHLALNTDGYFTSQCKDDEGQTPLHYAATCDREAIAEFLVKQNADIASKDNDGCSPSDLCESAWPWVRKID
ncbi:hypothetical protein Sjap_005567 [Stephania japonica]|uniref:ACB domain-containing protein n=1 Tax=Stephania japonica TaxID=461633 RepID=A0AAP0K5S2_9MAGN